MIKLLFILITIVGVCHASEGEPSSISELESSTGVSFGEVEEDCPKNKKKQGSCIKYRSCVQKRLRHIGDGFYYFLSSHATQYIHRQSDKEAEYCNGEPRKMQAIFYKKTSEKLVKLGSIDTGGCFLSVVEKREYKNSDIVETRCSFTGTAGFIKESYYLISDKGIKLIEFDENKAGLPHDSLGYNGFDIQEDVIGFHSWSHPRYCQCKKAFSAKLEIKEESNGEPFFNYLEGSYKPLFTSRSNSKNRDGLEFYHDEKYKLAAEKFLSATKLDVSNYEAFSNLGLTYVKMRMHEEALEVLKYVYNNASVKNKANAAYNIGLLYEDRSEFNKAIEFFEEANQLEESSARSKAIKRVKKHLRDQESGAQG